MPQFLEYFKYSDNFRQGGITASIQAGAFGGSLLNGAFIADRYGRKKTILFGSALFTIGCAIACASNGIACLVAGCVINGLGNCCLAMMVRLLPSSEFFETVLITMNSRVPLYQSEIAPRE